MRSYWNWPKPKTITEAECKKLYEIYSTNLKQTEFQVRQRQRFLLKNIRQVENKLSITVSKEIKRLEKEIKEYKALMKSIESGILQDLLKI